MVIDMEKNNSLEMAKLAIAALEDKKAEDIRVIDISEVSVIADYFIIATARSTAQAKAVYEHIDEKLSKEDGIEPLRVDGTKEGRWIVMDYGGVIVHIFNDDTRVLYCLEKLWADGDNVRKYESPRK